MEPGTQVLVGAPLATLHVDGEVPTSAAAAREAPRASPSILPATAPPPAATTPPAEGYKTSPAARRRAQELGLDATRIVPSSSEGVVSIADVERAAHAAAVPSPVPAGKREAMRQAIAAAMAKSKREIPHYYLGAAIDVTRASDWLAEINSRCSVKERILFAAVLLRAVAVALAQVPELNGFWVDGRFQAAASVHLGVGIALGGGGLIAPAIHDAQRKSLAELMAALSDLIARARGGALRGSELTDGTITVTNLGEQGVDNVYGVIYPPQVALVGFGRVGERPWAVDGAIQVRKVVQATLSADHRASVGHRGGLFLAKLDRLLQEPEQLG